MHNNNLNLFLGELGKDLKRDLQDVACLGRNLKLTLAGQDKDTLALFWRNSNWRCPEYECADTFREGKIMSPPRRWGHSSSSFQG